jgi:hypothetical protein
MTGRRLAATLAAAGLSTLMLAGPAAPAGAATGQLFLQGAGGSTVLHSPLRGCYAVVAGFTTVINHTDTAVTVYEQAGCGGQSMVVVPGGPVQVGLRHSVLVPS